MRSLVLLALVACSQGASTPSKPVPVPVKSEQINKPGEQVLLDDHLVAGYVVVVDFWGEHCGACKVVGGMLAVGVAQQDQVLIRKIDVGDGFTQVAKDYDINALPHYRIYDKKKRLRYDLVGNDCLKAPQIAKELAAEP
jgi:thiol-disulfide isomerase/thioredoxin